jgi:hypothetical protein
MPQNTFSSISSFSIILPEETIMSSAAGNEYPMVTNIRHPGKNDKLVSSVSAVVDMGVSRLTLGAILAII